MKPIGPILRRSILGGLGMLLPLGAATPSLAQPGGVRANAEAAFDDVEVESKKAAQERLAAPLAPEGPKAEAGPPRKRPSQAPESAVGTGSKVRAPEPARAEPTRAEPARTEPARAEPARAEPARAEPPPTVAPDPAALDRAALDRTVDLRRPDTALLDAAILHFSNAERARHGQQALRPHPALSAAALGHAERMATLDFFDHHDGQDRARRTPSDRARLAGIAKPFIAENIAISNAKNGAQAKTYGALARDIVTQWMNSPGHRANILSANGLQHGAAVVGHRNGLQVVAVQVFQWFEPAP